MKQTLATPGVVLVNPKYIKNVGGAIRSCSCFGVESLVWTGTRINLGAFSRIPREERMKGYKEVKWFQDERPLALFGKCTPIAVEVMPQAWSLPDFEHPEDAVYVFGPEDGGLPKMWRSLCHRHVAIPARHCLNLSVALGIVLAHRHFQRSSRGLEPRFNPGEHEMRGESVLLEEIGWNSK